MEAGRKLDILIAEKVFGREKELQYYRESSEGKRYPTEENNSMLPHYSTNIASAWEVINHLEKTLDGSRWTGEFRLLFTGGWWEAGWSFWESEKGTWLEESQANSAPHAICLAALKAINSSGKCQEND